ncbi:MAG: PD-(D/E)XK nuclease family protein, partial [Marinirhabdus sp.]
SETLLLNASTAVQGLVHTLTYCLDTKNETAKLGMLDFFAENLGVSTGKHDFFQQLLPLPPGELSEKLKTFTLQLDFEHPASLPLYEGFEYLLRQCELQQRAGAHLFGFMDLVLEFSIQQNKGARAFLEFWETKKETAAIATGHAAEAVRFMTIHQSKGLEFPVVLFPYANVKLYKEIDPKAWYPWEGTPHFEEVLISYKNEVAAYGPAGEKMAAERQETLQLDAINLLYVTLTRAVEQLYVFSEKPGKATESPSDFPQLFRAYLQHTAQWDEAKAIYRFGTPQRVSAPAQNPLKTTAPHYCATTPISHNLSITGKYTDTLPEALNFGNLLHTVMAKIETGADAAAVFDALKKRGVVAKGTMPRLEKSVNALLNHPGLKGYFNKENTILNERDIVTGEGLLLRPDRVIVKPDGTATILDYKTGSPKTEHEEQLKLYAAALTAMGFTVKEKKLIYVYKTRILVNNV